jgi:hypothetical protein
LAEGDCFGEGGGDIVGCFGEEEGLHLGRPLCWLTGVRVGGVGRGRVYFGAGGDGFGDEGAGER